MQRLSEQEQRAGVAFVIDSRGRDILPGVDASEIGVGKMKCLYCPATVRKPRKICDRCKLERKRQRGRDYYYNKVRNRKKPPAG